MSSLRLALKQSLEETSGNTPPPAQVHGPPPGGRTSPHSGLGSISSHHTEEDVTSPFPKKRGPGRPRKNPRPSDQPARKRGRPRKHPVDGEDAFSSENEFSVGGEGPESEHKEDETMSSAASKIQSHWKKKNKEKFPSLETSAVAEPSANATAETKHESSQHRSKDRYQNPPSPANPSKPVTPPTLEIVEWMRSISIKRARKAVAPGLRVKVRFVTKVKKEGKIIRKRIWYGGRITAVSKEGSKIKIKYDDKTSEVTQFPDKDVVVDDHMNGKHQCKADKFIPPEREDGKNNDEKLFAEGGDAEEPEPFQPSPTLDQTLAETHKASLESEKSVMDGLLGTEEQSYDVPPPKSPVTSDKLEAVVEESPILSLKISEMEDVQIPAEVSKSESIAYEGFSEKVEVPHLIPKQDEPRHEETGPPLFSVATETTASPQPLELVEPVEGLPSQTEVAEKLEEVANTLQQTESEQLAGGKVIHQDAASNSALDQSEENNPQRIEIDTSSEHQEKSPEEVVPHGGVHKESEPVPSDEVSGLSQRTPEESSSRTPKCLDENSLQVDGEKLSQVSDLPAKTGLLCEPALLTTSEETNLVERTRSDFEVESANVSSPVLDYQEVSNQTIQNAEHSDEKVNWNETVESSATLDMDVSAEETEIQEGTAQIDDTTTTSSKDEVTKTLAKTPHTTELADTMEDVPKLDVSDKDVAEEAAKPKRKRGRPPKHKPTVESEELQKFPSKALEAPEVTSEPHEEIQTTRESEEFKASSIDKSEVRTAGDIESEEAVEQKGSSNKPSLTIRIPNLKKVDAIQGARVKDDVSTKSAALAGSPRGKKRSNSPDDIQEPPTKRLHIHIGSKGTQEIDTSERRPEKQGTSKPKQPKSTTEVPPPSNEQQTLSPRPKKPKRKRDRDADLTPRPGSKPGKKILDRADEPHLDGLKRDRHVNETIDIWEKKGIKSTSGSGSDDLATPEARTKHDNQSAARSGRRAAQQANERIASKNDPLPEHLGKKKKKKRREMEDPDPEREDEIPAFQWVQCDSCAKWRIIPSSVVEKLPQNWYCANNKWDSKRASCDAPEQTPKQVAKERKRKRRKLMMEREAAEAEKTVGTTESHVAEMSSSPRNSDDATGEAHRASPSETSFDSGHLGEHSKVEKKGMTSSKKTKGAPSVELAHISEEDPKPRGRGRPRRNLPKEVSTPPAPPSNASGNPPSATDEADNLEWVQCEKCDKWRKLPPHISADELPEVWYCSMNTWNPGSANCSAPEDKADGLQDIFNNSNGAGKLSYRNLIFGSNGRKANRPISERTRAAESLFAAVSDDSDAPPAVMYANSSAFICRSKHQNSDENDGPTVLDLMSRSHLWTQLQKSQAKNATLLSSFDSLSIQARESMKDIVLHCLGSQTLTGEELHTQVKDCNWENAPLGWADVRSYCSENMIVMTLCELVKMGVLECYRVDGPFANGHLWSLCYRRAKTYSPVSNEASMKVDLPANGSRCMKIAKPWKKVT